MRKICVITGTRAEYGLLTPLIHAIQNDKDLKLQLIVTGAHLSPAHGLTYKEIEKEFTIDKKIDLELDSDTPVGISKSMGLALIGFGKAYAKLHPDIVVVLGDRYEILSAVSAAMIAQLPIAHINGGELTQGAIDDAMRHAITKMSHIHFVATETYKKRVMQLGEDETRIFNFGEVGLDNIKQLHLLNKEEFEQSIEFQLGKKNLLFTFHPTTLESQEKIISDFQKILDFLDTLKETHVIFTKANADNGGKVINEMLAKFVTARPHTKLFSSLGRFRYLSALLHVDAVLGNSSSGIIEAPSFKVATINIGDRQKGRVQATNVINCSVARESLTKAIERLYTQEFQNSLQECVNPYEREGSVEKTKEVLKNISLEAIIKKDFKDIL